MTLFKRTFTACRIVFFYALVFSFVSNLLMLAMPIYSMQVLDRVLSSNSIDTLLMLTLVVLAAVLGLVLLQMARSFVLARMANWIEKRLAPIVFAQSVVATLHMKGSTGSQPLRDLATIKGFLNSQFFGAMLDAPWSTVFFVLLFMVHPYLGGLAVVGALLLLVIAIANERGTKPITDAAQQHFMESMQRTESATQNAEVIEAMGMTQHLIVRWQDANRRGSSLQSLASNRSALFSNITKFLRQAMQVAITGLGAYLAIRQEISTGSIIACSIMMGRALAPFDVAIGMWNSCIQARTAYQRLERFLERDALRPEAMTLPKPLGRLTVENVFFTPLGLQQPVLRNIHFALDPGDILGIVGPSAAGKSTLAKLLVGIWKAQNGVVRLDGADIYSWDRADIGNHMGYLPQDVELFHGTIRDNIARLAMDADPTDVVEAAKFANVHEMILRLPRGYETEISGRSSLSAGQRQRIGLARAFYKDVRLVVLDEPNSNLDQDGDAALADALRKAKARGITTVIISHRPAILSEVDKILVLHEGVMAGFGRRDEVLAKLMQVSQQGALAAPGGGAPPAGAAGGPGSAKPPVAPGPSGGQPPRNTPTGTAFGVTAGLGATMVPGLTAPRITSPSQPEAKPSKEPKPDPDTGDPSLGTA